MKNEVIKRIQSTKASIGVVGLGYVGLPLALRFAEANFKVVGFDVDVLKLEQLLLARVTFAYLG